MNYPKLLKKSLNRISDLETRKQIEDGKPRIKSYMHYSPTWLIVEIERAKELHLNISKRYAKTILKTKK